MAFFRVPIHGSMLIEAETREEAEEIARDEKQHADVEVGQAELVKESR